MAWVTNDGAADTYNVSFTKGTEVIFALKKLLKSVGWTVPSSSDGSTYDNTGVDQISHNGTGPGGMENDYAWFRLRDPGSRREYVFQRQTSNESWIGKYSALSKFDSGSPSATQTPTASDEVGFAKTSAITASTMFTSGSQYYHMAAQSVAESSNVYPFWFVAASGSTITGFLCVESVRDVHASDADPSVLIWHSSVLSVNDFSSVSAGILGKFLGWSGYGGASAEYGNLNLVQYSSNSGILFPTTTPPEDPFTSNIITLPSMLWRSNSQGLYVYKGWGRNIRINSYSNILYPNLFYDGAVYHLCTSQLLLPGWPNSTGPLIV